MKKIPLLISLFFMAIFPVSAQHIDINSGLIAHYNFDGNADDELGKSNGTVYGATLDTGICESQSYFFNGTSDYIDCGNDPSLNGRFSGLSISVWIKLTNLNTQQLSTILAKWAFDPQNDHFGLWLDPNNRVVFAVSEPRYMENGTFSAHHLDPETWYNIVATWNRNRETKIYINGIIDQVGQQTGYGINFHSDASLKIGRQVVRKDRPFRGNIDEIRIYNRTLNDKEAVYLYNEGITMCQKVFVQGQVLNKKTGLPEPGTVHFDDMSTGDEFLSIETEGDQCEYKATLPLKRHFALYAKSDNFLSINENINTGNYPNNQVIQKNLYLVPVEVGQSISLNNIFFDFNKATLKKESFAELDRVIPLFTQFPNLKIEIAGHTDSVGSDEYNQNLSEARAASVREYLLGKGVDADRITAKGYGESQPIASNDTDEGRAQNRRVEFRILEK